MELNAKIAKQIVKDLKEIIHYNINFIDNTGEIIASTDEKRIGTLHMAAIKVVQNRVDVIVHHDDEYSGAIKGVNLPIVVGDEIVAVIGITGEPRKVISLWNTIKKMTEILIRENLNQLLKANQQKNYNSLINILISKNRDEEMAEYLFKMLNFKRNISRNVIVGNFRDELPFEEAEQVLSILHKYLKVYKNAVYNVSHLEVVIIMETQQKKDFASLLEKISKEISQKTNNKIVFAVSCSIAIDSELWKSKKECDTIFSSLKNDKQSFLVFYDDLDLELILSAVDRQTRKDYLNKIFQSLSDEEINEFQEIFEAYANHNGSIIHGAAELFIHKNTFQNKLNKVYEKTGYNPRDLKQFSQLDFAFKLLKYRRDSIKKRKN